MYHTPKLILEGLLAVPHQDVLDDVLGLHIDLFDLIGKEKTKFIFPSKF